MLTIVLCLVLCFAVITRWLWPRKAGGIKPPYCPGAIPLVGHVHKVLRKKNIYNFMQMVSNNCLKNDGVIRLLAGTLDLYVVGDPEDCYTVANTCLHKSYIYDFFKDWSGAGIFSADVENWKRDRKLLLPAFSHLVLNEDIAIFNSQSRKLVKDLSPLAGKGLVNVEDHILKHNMEVTCRTLLLLANDASEESKIFQNISAELMELTANRILSPWLHPDSIYQWTSDYKKTMALIKINQATCSKIAAQRKIEIQNNEINNSTNTADDFGKFRPLLDLILKLSVGNNNFRDDKLIDHITTFIVAAFDTTSTAITASLVVIGTYKRVQDKLFEELQNVFGDSKKDIDKNDLPRLVYLEAVIKETLRLYSVVPAIFRVTDQEIKLRNYTIPAGYNVLLMLHAVNRHSSWGPDANEFRPERWLEKGGVPENRNAFAAFSVGRRDCIGKRHAMMSLKITLVHLLREFRISGDVNKLEFHIAPTMKIVAGHDLALELRQ